ncbi:MAG: hypothetical protein ACK55I_13210, partial [bacterium]
MQTSKLRIARIERSVSAVSAKRAASECEGPASASVSVARLPGLCEERWACRSARTPLLCRVGTRHVGKS